MTPIRLERERRLFARSGIDVPSQTAGRLQLGRALVLRRVPALAAIAVGVLVSSLSLPTQADADDGKVKVNVVVDGLNADMKRNVLSSLELATATRSGALPAGEVYRLANRAPQQIELALQPFGYYRPVIRDAMQTDGGTWTARYSIEPGPPVVLSAVDVEISGPGKDLPGFTQAIRQFSLKPGGRLEHAPYEALKLSLSKAAASNGFLDARYPVRRLEVDRTANTGQVIVHFETGPRYFFGPVRFDQQMLDSSLVHSFVPFQVGQPFDADSLLLLQNDLSRSTYFSRVEVEPRKELADSVTLQVPIDVTLEPGKRMRYTLGFGYGTDTGALVKGTVEFKRLNAHGHRAEINGLLSELNQAIGVQYQMPRFYNHKQLLTLSANYQAEETDVQRNEGGQIGAAISRLRAGWQESFGLYFQKGTFTVGLDRGNPHLLMPDLQWTKTVTDDRVFTNRGQRLMVELRAAYQPLLSTATFAQISLQTKMIRTFAKGSRVILRADAGRTFTQDFHDLPPAIRYFSGGSESVRSYGYQTLGPIDDSGEPTGGIASVLGSVEVDHRVLKSWALAAFYDIGTARLEAGDPFGDGIGAGIRWVSPVGALRLSLAFPLLDIGRDVRPYQLQFSIGPDL